MNPFNVKHSLFLILLTFLKIFFEVIGDIKIKLWTSCLKDKFE